MPWKSDKQRRWGHTAAGQKALGGKKAVAEWDRAKKKPKVKVMVDNKIKGSLGASEFRGKGRPNDKKPTGKILINVKAHKGDRAELASTIKHELMHVQNPKMTEREVYKRTAKTKISPMEQSKLLAKLRHKRFHYKTGAVKRKLKLKGEVSAGELINKSRPSSSRERLVLMGMV